MPLKTVLALFLMFFCAGCASTIGAVTNRPVVEDGVKDVISTVSLSADRRTVVVVTSGENQSKFCAEPPPDTATGLKTHLDATLEAKRISGNADPTVKVKDELTTTVAAIVGQRTPPLDAFRTGVYALCQFHLNGAISREDVRPMFEKLINAFVEAFVDSDGEKSSKEAK